MLSPAVSAWLMAPLPHSAIVARAYTASSTAFTPA
jgi:hypothetical protein